MKRKLALASTGLILILATSVTLMVSTPSTSANPVENHRYIVMGGITSVSGPVVLIPYCVSPRYLTPMLMGQNITFSELDPVTGVVYLTVPATSYVGLEHVWYNGILDMWYRYRVTMDEDGYGWLFTGEGTSPILGDVDYRVFNNDTGVYFFGPDGLAGTADDSFAGPPPQTGSDQVPGTSDDDFGTLNTTAGVPRTPDPLGSSILYLPTTLYWEYWDDALGRWDFLFESPLPMLMTTAVAYDIVVEPASDLNSVNSTGAGEPWEFFAGLDHPEYSHVPYGHPQWNAYVTYACSWSVLNVSTPLGDLDMIYQAVEKLVREDCVIADIDCNEEVDIIDIVICALAFGSKPGDPNWDPRGDLREPRGEIKINDLVGIGINFAWKLTPDGIIRPLK